MTRELALRRPSHVPVMLNVLARRRCPIHPLACARCTSSITRRVCAAKAAQHAHDGTASQACSGACAVPPLEIEVQAIQLSPYRAGLAGRHPTRLPMAPASPTCSCPLRLSPSGQSDDPEASLCTSPDCVRDSAPRPAAHALTTSGSTPLVHLYGTALKRPVTFLQLHRAFPVDSSRVRWVPLLPSAHRRGAFASRPHPGVHGFPTFRLLRPIRLCWRALAFRWGLPSLLPTRLHIPHAVSRVHHGRRTRNEGGGVFLSLALPRFAAPQALDKGEDRFTSVTMIMPSLGLVLVRTRSARVCLRARLADLVDKGGQGQRFP